MRNLIKLLGEKQSSQQYNKEAVCDETNHICSIHSTQAFYFLITGSTFGHLNITPWVVFFYLWTVYSFDRCNRFILYAQQKNGRRKRRKDKSLIKTKSVIPGFLVHKSSLFIIVTFLSISKCKNTTTDTDRQTDRTVCLFTLMWTANIYMPQISICSQVLSNRPIGVAVRERVIWGIKSRIRHLEACVYL